MEEFLDRHGVLFKQLKPFVLRQAERLKRHACAVAAQASRPWEYLEGPVGEDQHARAIAAWDGVTEGLVCVFGTGERCRSFRLAYQHGRPAIRPAPRLCRFLSVSFVDREFGFRHIRLQTWFPFTIQVYVNGHEWLASWTGGGCATAASTTPSCGSRTPARGQRLADRFATLKWPAFLDTLACRVNPLLRDVLQSYRDYWATNQAEYATDVFFKRRPAVRDLHPRNSEKNSRFTPFSIPSAC